MSAGQHNLIIEKGATFSRTITWTESDGTTPIDITGYSARMHIRADINDQSAALELTTGNGRITITDAVNGVFTLNITATDTAALSLDEGVYDLELEDAGGVVTRLLEGGVILRDEVTR